MAIPKTLAEFAAEQRKRFSDGSENARNALTMARDELVAARAERERAVEELARLQKKIAETRQAIPLAPMAADAEALVEALRALMVELRARRKAVADAEDHLERATWRLQFAESRLNGLTAALAASELELKNAEKRAALHEEWKNALAAAPLSTLPADAAAALGGQRFAEAKARVEADLPAPLLKRAMERGLAEATRMESLRSVLLATEDALGEHLKGNGGRTGRVTRLWVPFLRAEGALRDYVAHAGEHLERALGLLQRIVESPELTAPERAWIWDAALDPEREAALEKEQARDEAQAAEEAKEAEMEKRRAVLTAEDIDADEGADAAMQALKAELAALEAALAAAEQDFTPAMHDTLEAWAASVPEHIWANVAHLGEATGLLEGLRTFNPAAARTAMANAEKDLTAALAAQDKSSRTRMFFGTMLEGMRALADTLAASQRRRILGAVRGER